MNPETARITAKELQLERSSKAPVVFHGFSMWPFLREDDLLVISPVSFDDVEAGDIVTFRKADKFPTYRVVEKAPHVLTVQGDNWPDVVVEVQPGDVLGIVVARERDGTLLTRDSWRWRLVARLRLTFVARKFRHEVTRVVRALLDFASEQQRVVTPRTPSTAPGDRT